MVKARAFDCLGGIAVSSARAAQRHQVPQARGSLCRHLAAQRLVQAAEHHVGQHLAGDVARGDWRRLLGVQDRVLGRGDADHRERAFVVRHLGRHDALHAEGGIGLGVADRHVDAVARDARGARKVDVDAGGADFHGGDQVDRLVVAVDRHRELVFAGLDLRDRLERSVLGLGEDMGTQAIEIVDCELVHHLDQAAAADFVAGRERVEVAHHLDRLAHVGAHNVYQRLVDLARTREVHQWNVEAFLIVVARVGRHAAAANIDDVAGRGEQRHHLAAPEGRRDKGKIMKVARALPWVVGQEDVAFLHGVGRELVEEVIDRARHRIDVAGRAGHRLGEHGAAEVEHAGGEVTGFARRSREAGAHQRQRLLLDDRDQAVPHQLKANG